MGETQGKRNSRSWFRTLAYGASSTNDNKFVDKWQDKSGFRLPRVVNYEKIWEETKGVRFVCKFLWCHLMKVYLQRRKIYVLPLGRRRGGYRDNFWYFLLLNCLQLKIIIMSKRHLLGWHILVSFNPFTYLGQVIDHVLWTEPCQVLRYVEMDVDISLGKASVAPIRVKKTDFRFRISEFRSQLSPLKSWVGYLTFTSLT